MMTWKRCKNSLYNNWEFITPEGENIATIDKNQSNDPVWLTVCLDPRTGKPWKNMKVAKEWFDEATKPKRKIRPHPHPPSVPVEKIRAAVKKHSKKAKGNK